MHLDVALASAVEVRRPLRRGVIAVHRDEHHTPDDDHETEFVDERRGVPAAREIGRQLRRHREGAPLGDGSPRALRPFSLFRESNIAPLFELVELREGSERVLRASHRRLSRPKVFVVHPLPERPAQIGVPREAHREARVAVEFAPQLRGIVPAGWSAPRAEVHRAVGLTEECDARVAPPETSLGAVAEVTHRDACSSKRGQVFSVEVRRNGGHHLVREGHEGALVGISAIAHVRIGTPFGALASHGASLCGSGVGVTSFNNAKKYRSQTAIENEAGTVGQSGLAALFFCFRH